MSKPKIMNITFADNGVEVIYFEEHEQGKTAGLVRQLSVAHEVCPQIIDSALEIVQDIVDAGILAMQEMDRS